MKNIEKYRNELIIAIEESSVCIFAKKRGIPVNNCIKHNCCLCKETFVDWLLEEYQPQIDWSKVPVDTPVIVREKSGLERKRHFSKYEKLYNEPFFCFNDGKTSFTGNNTTSCDNCRLALEKDIEKYSI